MLVINDRLRIAESEFAWSFVRASGPGGQNVNKVASKAVLRWPVVASSSLPSDVKTRLLIQQRSRLTTEGELVITSQRFRDQERNREDCLAKVRQLVVNALMPPKPRKRTKPTRGSQEARLRAKRRRSATKTSRRDSGQE
jgi:ribosome-associated protein